MRYLYLFLTYAILCWGCNKLLDVDTPVNSINAGNVFKSDATAAALMTDIYAQMSQASITGGEIWLTGLSAYGGLSSDELFSFDQTNLVHQLYLKNSLLSINPGGSHFWNSSYKIISLCNTVIENVPVSPMLSADVARQLLGEARFMRAFCYMYLENLYGNVPLATSTDYKINAELPRSDSTIVYNLIDADLTEAIDMLSEKFLSGDLKSPTGERVRPTKWSAIALLARSYLYQKKYSQAEIEASRVISSADKFELVGLDEVFKMNSMESIWQLQPVLSGASSNSQEGFAFILPQGGPNADHPYVLTNVLLSSFDKGDLRRTKWIDSVEANGSLYHFPAKYKSGEGANIVGEYSTVLRLAEQYLIRAEARLFANNLSGAIEDLNLIRKRARGNDPGDLPDLPDSLTKDQLLGQLISERRSELFTEWGHRWIDLKRLQVADRILAEYKGQDWQPTDKLYPIPQYEINKNPSLRDSQNPGY